MPSAMSISNYFDTRLMMQASWSEEDIKQIEKWIKEDAFEEKRIQASKLISYMICSLLSENCSSNGKIRAKRLGQLFQHFEDMLATTKGGMAPVSYTHLTLPTKRIV